MMPTLKQVWLEAKKTTNHPWGRCPQNRHQRGTETRVSPDTTFSTTPSRSTTSVNSKSKTSCWKKEQRSTRSSPSSTRAKSIQTKTWTIRFTSDNQRPRDRPTRHWTTTPSLRAGTTLHHWRRERNGLTSQMATALLLNWLKRIQARLTTMISSSILTSETSKSPNTTTSHPKTITGPQLSPEGISRKRLAISEVALHISDKFVKIDTFYMIKLVFN